MIKVTVDPIELARTSCSASLGGPRTILHHHVPNDHPPIPVVVLARRPPCGPTEEPPRRVAERGVALGSVGHDDLQGSEMPVRRSLQWGDGRERPVRECIRISCRTPLQ